MTVVGLDLGTKTGYAIMTGGVLVNAGTWTLASPKAIKEAAKLRLDRRGDPRFFLLKTTLFNLTLQHKVDWIVFEDVQFSSTTMQTQLWATWRAAVWSMAPAIKIECVPVATLKKFATGNGGATKEGMARALVKADDRFRLDGENVRDTLSSALLDDNAVDAIHLARWGHKTLRG